MNLCVQSGGAVGHFDKPTVYRLIKEAGFSSIDLNIDTCFNAGYLKDHMNEGKNPYEKGPEAVIDWYRADIDAIRDAGLYIYQAHAPFPAYRPDAPAAFVDYSIETFKVALEVCRRIGCGRLIRYCFLIKLHQLPPAVRRAVPPSAQKPKKPVDKRPII